MHTEQKESSANKVEGKLQEDLIIDLASKQGTFTRKDLERTLGMSQTICGRLIKRMIESGQIGQEGKGRNTHYRFWE